MAERKRSVEELELDFIRQVKFLKSSCKAFDEGNFDEAIRMAVHLRILLHDTRSSKSILMQMGIKDSMKLIDTSTDYIPDNHLAYMGLIVIKIGEGPLDSGYRASLKSNGTSRLVSFNDWWNKVIIQDLHKNDFTRKDLVTTVANQDGGAHVDPTIEENYARLSRDNSLGWSMSENGVLKRVPDGVFHSIRQIAFEVLTTFDDRIAI